MHGYLKEKYRIGKRPLNRFLLPVFVMGLVVFNITAGFFAPLNYVAAQVDSQSLLELHNDERQQLGLGDLKISAKLNAAANAKAQAMLDSNCWSHYCPNGTSPWEFFLDVDYDYIYAGENLAEGFYNNETVMRAWMNSESHRANIMSDRFTEVGFGYARGSFQGNPNNLIVVVHFGHSNASSQVFASGDSTFDLTQPEILSPAQDSYVQGPRVEIFGKATAGDRVLLSLNGNRPDFADANEGIFTYRYEYLDEDKYILTAQAEDGTQLSEVSEPVTFTVDRTPDQASIEELRVIDSNWKQAIELNKPELAEVAIISGDDVYNMVPLDSSRWELDTSNINFREIITIKTTDLAGNRVDAQINISDVVIASDWSLLPNMSIRSWVNVFAIGAIIIILLGDIWYARRYEQQTGIKHHHFHIGIMITLFLVVVFNNLIGDILDGINL